MSWNEGPIAAMLGDKSDHDGNDARPRVLRTQSSQRPSRIAAQHIHNDAKTAHGTAVQYCAMKRFLGDTVW